SATARYVTSGTDIEASWKSQAWTPTPVADSSCCTLRFPRTAVSTAEEATAPTVATGARRGGLLSTLLEAMRAVGRIGTRGQPPARAREIALTSQVAVISIAATLPYQLFYLSDVFHYFPVLAANVFFIAC